MLPPGRNTVPGQIKQGGEPDSAHWPCVCHLWSRSSSTAFGICFTLFILDAHKVCVFLTCVILISAHWLESLWRLLSPCPVMSSHCQMCCTSESQFLIPWTAPLSCSLPSVLFSLCCPPCLHSAWPSLSAPYLDLSALLLPPLCSDCPTQSTTAVTATTNSTGSFSVISPGVGVSHMFF